MKKTTQRCLVERLGCRQELLFFHVILGENFIILFKKSLSLSLKNIRGNELVRPTDTLNKIPAVWRFMLCY